MIHTVTSREFAHNVSSAKALAKQGPVFITDRGQPAFVLMHISEYRTITGATQQTSLLEAMHSIPSAGKGIELELPAREREDFDSRVPDFETGSPS